MSINIFKHAIENNTNLRFEKKYRLGFNEYYAIKNSLTPYLNFDPFTKIAPMNKYLVRSLYFDTRDYKTYKEKINGDGDRIKFRIRTYNTQPKDNLGIRVELKVRKGNLMEKYGAFITLQQYENLLKKRDLHFIDNPVLVEFIRYIYKWDLVPKTIVQYFREGFQSKFQDGIRITFDHNIMCAFSKDLFPENIYWRKHYHSHILMEIKFKENIPVWLNNVIHSYNLKIVPNSKYTNSIDLASQDIKLGAW
jgi:hypothetical protein